MDHSVSMSYPRRLLVPPDCAGTYHCMSRCVRRAFLCGEDPVTGQSFEHRKAWLERRIVELGNLFAVAVHAYAVMSNHLHVVLAVDPGATANWSDEVVASRWIALTSTNGTVSAAARIDRLLEQPERLVVLRARLGSLSWFMRFLKEPIARMANKEDCCTGRFWEGRFKTQALLDDTAVLACMTYVDLNPVRAGIVQRAQEGPRTSIRQRVRSQSLNQPLTPLAATINAEFLDVSLAGYLELVAWTGRQLHKQDASRIPRAIEPILQRIDTCAQQWLIQVPATESHYWRAIGKVRALTEFAQALGQRWLRGIGTARAVERPMRVTGSA